MEKYKITLQKQKDLPEELDHLINVEKPELADRLDANRDDSTDDLDSSISELLDEKAAIERRINDIKQILANHEIIKKTSSKKIDLGAKVDVKVNGKKNTYQLVASLEADPLNSKISVDSPLGKGLIGHKVGDIVEISIGGKDSSYKIEKVCYS